MKRHISTDEAVEVENVEFVFNRIETHYIPDKSYVISLGDMRWRGGSQLMGFRWTSLKLNMKI
jgi:hypothetical protein